MFVAPDMFPRSRRTFHECSSCHSSSERALQPTTIRNQKRRHPISAARGGGAADAS